MTAQAGDGLLYKGEWHGIAGEPLGDYLKTRPDIQFQMITTACQKGYSVSWEIIDNKLYLVSLRGNIGTLDKYQFVDLNYVFPGQDKVFAEWVNDSVVIPQGDVLCYIHSGFVPLTERHLFLVFEKGVLVNEYEVDNYDRYLEHIANDNGDDDLPF